MNTIQWKKWVIELLPIQLRSIRMGSLCLVLVSPITSLHAAFKAWHTRMDRSSACTPQTCMLQHIINEELGITAVIEEGNGKPIDFSVHVNFNDVDKERKLFALLDRYKQSGRRYDYKNTEIVLMSLWGGYIDEIANVHYIWDDYIEEICKVRYEWDDYVEELARKPVVELLLHIWTFKVPMSSRLLNWQASLSILDNPSNISEEFFPVATFDFVNESANYFYSYTNAVNITSVGPEYSNSDVVRFDNILLSHTEDVNAKYVLIIEKTTNK